jgi:F0F1-type ATP synthase membrane subunit c/vacuolar-type H+-ATPase subunit K
MSSGVAAAIPIEPSAPAMEYLLLMTTVGLTGHGGGGGDGRVAASYFESQP